MSDLYYLLHLKNRDLENMSPESKKRYFTLLRDYVYKLNKPNNKISFGQRFIEKYNPKIRKFDYEIIGEENIPDDGAIIIVNHSNSHDIINMYELLTTFDLNSSVLLTSEGLNPLVLSLFRNANATVIDRFDKEKSLNGVYELSNKVMNNTVGVFFGEGTWNLHPIKLMHDIKLGATKAAAISKKPIIPTIMEYLEYPYICDKESKLYKKCVIYFGKPIYIDEEKSLIEQNNEVQKTMESMRKSIWTQNDIKRDKLEDVNPIIYINHTWLKEYNGLANGYDASVEDRVLYSKDGTIPENEYYLDQYGNFVPGTIPKKCLIKK